MAKITFLNKVKIKDIAVPEINKFTDANANEIKTSVNALYDEKLDKNTAIVGATKTKITYDADGLITSGVDATTADIADSLNKRYVSDAEKTAITASKTKTDFLTITQAVDLDDIEIRVNNLDAAVVLKGAWDASAGTFPGAGIAQAGFSYQVTVAGTVNGIDFSINDRIIALVDNASTTIYAPNWLKADYSDLVSSFNTRTGAVVLLNTDVSDLITAQTEKVTAVDADTMPLLDSATTFGLKKITWANIKATLKTYFDTLFISGSGTQNYLPKFGVGGKVVGNSQIVDNGTNVGVKTDTPGKPLDINGDARIRGDLATLNFYRLTGAVDIAYLKYNNTPDSSGYGVFSLGAATKNIVFFNKAGYAESARINIDGNLGVNVILPTEKIHAVGNGKFTGSVQVGDNTAVASESNVGAQRYRVSGNNSYVDVCMQTGASTYAWVNTMTQSW